MKIFSILGLICLVLYSSAANADSLSMYLDKNVLSEGDVLSLTVEYSGEDKGKPDLSYLEKDFQIVSNSSSSQYSYVNGMIEQSKKWTLGLKPRKSGKISIKPVKFAGLTSNYVDVEVKELTDVAYIPDSENNFNSPYFQIKQEFDMDKAYLHQQIRTNVIIYDSLGIKNGHLNLSNNAKDDWVIRGLTEKPFVEQKIINGKKMNVITFSFALFPQKSGNLVAPSFLFDGYYLKDANFGFADFNDDFMMFGVDFRNAFGQKVPVRMETKKKTIDVLPNTDGFLLKNWLPAKMLEVSSEFSFKNGIKVGEAFNQTITVRAFGMDKNFLPDIKLPEIDGIKQYPEKPVYEEVVFEGNIVSSATYNVVYIPSKTGEFVIPKIDVKWFNVEKNRTEISSTKEEKITVMPSNVFNAEESNIINSKEEEPANLQPKKEEKKVKQSKNKEQSLLNNESKLRLWFIVCIGIVFSLFIGFWFGTRKSQKQSVATFKNAVINSIQRHDYRTAKNMLIEWAKLKFDDENIRNFRDIANYIKNSQFEKQLDILNKLLYSEGDDLFDCVGFVKEFKNIDKVKIKKNKNAEILPNLYN